MDKPVNKQSINISYPDSTFRSRGYLPHVEKEGATYFVTLRLADTLPQNVLCEIEEELQSLKKRIGQLTKSDPQRLRNLQSKRIQEYLDRSIGECWLKHAELAESVKQAVLHGDGTSYVSHLCCIMPNHLHWLLTPQNGGSLTTIMQRLKSFTAHVANRVLKSKGSFWAPEYYDHMVRSEEEFGKLLVYTANNPVKAGLCHSWQDWRWTFGRDVLMKALLEEREF